MIKGFHHPAIVVPDLEKAREFYEQMFDFKVHHKKNWEASDQTYNQIVGLKGSSIRGCVMQGQNCYLELYEYSSPPSSEDPKKLGANDYGIRHLAFEVDDVWKEWERLKELGGIHMNDPVVLDPDGGGAVYCRDPFGNIIELTNAGESTGYYPSILEFQTITIPDESNKGDE